MSLHPAPRLDRALVKMSYLQSADSKPFGTPSPELSCCFHLNSPFPLIPLPSSFREFLLIIHDVIQVLRTPEGLRNVPHLIPSWAKGSPGVSIKKWIVYFLAASVSRLRASEESNCDVWSFDSRLSFKT